MSYPSNRALVVSLLAWVVAAVAGAGIADARPIRGPVARAERRVFRAQVALERELARPPGRPRVIGVPVAPVSPGGVPGAGAEAILPPAVPTPAQAGGPAAAPTQADRPAVPRAASAAAAPAPAAQPGVARTAFEAPAPGPAAAASPPSATPPAPAADGTVSVLVRPDARPAGQPQAQERSAEPLLFPGTSQP